MGKFRASFWAGALAALGLAVAAASCGQRRDAVTPEVTVAPALIARADLFGDAVRAKPQLSPRGDQIAFLAPRDGFLNVWVVPVDSIGDARPLTDHQDRGVYKFAWAPDGSGILYLQDERGDENFRLHAIDLASGESRALTPSGARADILGLSANDPTGVVVSLNERDTAWPDVFRINIPDGERRLLMRNANTAASRGYAQFVVDRENNVRLGLKSAADGSVEVWARPGDGRWANLFAIPFEDSMESYPIAFEAGGRTFLMFDSTGRDRAALVRVDVETGAKTVLGESPRADVIDVWLDPTTNAPEAFAAEYLRRDWRGLDPEAQADLEFLDAQLTGEANVVSRSLDDERWIVIEDGPTTPARSYLYDRSDPANRRLTLLFRHRPALDNASLQPMIPVEIEARDGITLVSYLTLPPGSDDNSDSLPDQPAPMVLLVHGGPWDRDSYGYNAMHQWLANRGYAVLSVNFRGSTGFGKAFLNAGNREWGGRMQDDLNDAVQWAIDRGIAQADFIGVFGGSYGGYAAMQALAATPERFACGVSFSGPANLTSLLDAIPARWAAYRDELYLRVGDPRTPEGRQLLRDRSPVTRAGDIQRPLLLALGGRDRLAARADHDVIAQASRARRAGLIYLNFPEEGHYLNASANRLSFYAISEQFLGECLGGRVEPVGAAFEGAQMQALEGASRVPGLSAFAPRRVPAAVSPAPDAVATPDPSAGAGGPDVAAPPPDDAAADASAEPQ